MPAFEPPFFPGSPEFPSGQDLDVIQGGGFVTIAHAFDADLVAGAKGDSAHDSPGRGGRVDAARGQTIGSGPLVDELAADQETEARDAVDLVEVADVDGVPAGWTLVAQHGRASGNRTGDRLAAGSGFPRGHVAHGIAFELHGLGFETPGVMSHAAFGIRDPGGAEEPVIDGVAPDLRLPRLVVELGEDFVVAAVVDAAVECLPLANVVIDRGRALVMRVVEVLDYGLAGVQPVGVGNVVEEEQQIVGAGFQGFVHLCNNWPILSRVAGALGHGAFQNYALFVGIVPLASPVAFGSFDAHVGVVADNIGEGLQAERAGVVFVRAPGGELDGVDGLHGFWVAAEGEFGPLVGDALRAEIGIPCQSSEAVEIGLRQMVAEPVFVEADARDADESARGAVEGLAGDQCFHRRGAPAGMHVEIEYGLPHGDRKTVWRAWPKYSWVICSSIAWLVFSSAPRRGDAGRSEEHTSELQSPMYL